MKFQKNIKSDTEVTFYYLSYLIDKYKDADDAIKVFQKTIRGNFAFVIFIKKNNCFYVLKNGSPIAISNKNNSFYISSFFPFPFFFFEDFARSGLSKEEGS